MALINSCLTTDLSAPGDMSSPGAYRVRLYLPVANHAVSWTDNVASVGAPNNVPSGVLIAPTETSDAAIIPLKSALKNAIDSGFGNTTVSFGKWELAIALSGVSQRLTVYDASTNPSGLIPQDATDASGNAIYNNASYSLGGGIYGMTGDQLRNEILWLAMRQSDFGRDRTVTDASTTSASTTVTSASASFTSDDVGKPIMIGSAGASGGTLVTKIASYVSGTEITVSDAASSTGTSRTARIGSPLYYMYPHWRGESTPHFFRGSLRSLSLNDEAAKREAYDFNIAFIVSNARPTE